MSEIISIRPATTDDVELLTRLSFTTFWDAFAHHPKNAPDDLDHYMRQAFSLEQIAAELADARNVFLIADVEEKAAGYAKVVIDRIEPGITATHPIELARLYSHQDYIGKGVGQDLMDACFDLGRMLDRDVMWLGVWEYNPRAQRFYKKNGFRVVGSHVFLLGDDEQTDLLMEKNL